MFSLVFFVTFLVLVWIKRDVVPYFVQLVWLCNVIQTKWDKEIYLIMVELFLFLLTPYGSTCRKGRESITEMFHMVFLT